mgnify:CR=1 FL=1
MGRHTDRRAAHYGFVFRYDPDRLRPDVQLVDVCGHRTDPTSRLCGRTDSNVGKNFIRSYAGVCLQGLVIALSCVIFSALAASPPSVDTSASVVTAVWTYVAELTFNLLVLVGAIKGCDRIVKEIMGL